MHGYGSNRQDMAGLADAFQLPIRTLVIDAPHTLEHLGMVGGRAWFNLSQTADGSLTYAKGEAIAAIETLESFLASWMSEHLDPNTPLVVGGFSQGAMMSHSLLLRGNTPLSAILGLSARDMVKDLGITPQTAQTKATPVFMSHGTADIVIPISFARSLKDFYEQTDAKLTYHEYPMAHEISQDCFNDARAWLIQQLQ